MDRFAKPALFSRSDVLALTGLTDAQLKNTLDRDLVRLDVDHNPGTGRRRMFTGSDVLKLMCAHALSDAGVPLSVSRPVVDKVLAHAQVRRLYAMAPDALSPRAVFSLFRGPDGQWDCCRISGSGQHKRLPALRVVLDADHFIDDALCKMAAVHRRAAEAA